MKDDLSLTNEKWVDLIGFDGIYEVSNLGRIKSLGRWVPNGKSERWVKEKIKKQSLCKDGRMSSILNVANKKYSINIPAVVFLSFNNDKNYNPKINVIAHKDKNKTNNILTNLCIMTISDSHKLNFEKNLLPHLKINNDKKHKTYSKITHKICNQCKIKLSINNFEYNRNKCLNCRKIEKKTNYEKQIKKVNS